MASFRHHLRYTRTRLLPISIATSSVAAALIIRAQYNTLYTDATPDDANKGKQLDYSQHAQVSMSWENPGCYIWGSNRQGVADVTSADSFAKTATRLAAFDGMALRDVKVSEDMGVAVLDSGDVCQWGRTFTGSPPPSRKSGQVGAAPEVTLQGKDIVKVELSSDTIYALSRKGDVYALPFTKAAQAEGPKPQESWLLGLMSNTATISYKVVKSPLSKGDKICDIAAGKDHVLLLSRNGSVLSASQSPRGNERGQMGIPSLPSPAEDSEISATQISGLRNARAIAIACGEHHSVVLDADGEVFSFGSNAHGQLAFDFNAETSNVNTPTMVSVASLYPRNYSVKCLKIAAGGKNTYMVVQNQQYDKPNSAKIDIWASGMGQFGQLGNNTWNHYQAKPVKLKVISGLTEWDEANNTVCPIGVHTLSVGSIHTVCCLDNYSKVDAEAASSRSSFHDVNYGRDVFVWGGNADFQIGNGKRNNRPMPEYIAPMETSATEMAVKSGWEEEGHKRFQLTPQKEIMVKTAQGSRVKRNVEQAIIAGEKVSCCYMKVVLD